MDPDTALESGAGYAREAIAKYVRSGDLDDIVDVAVACAAPQLADAFALPPSEALDGWLSKGGFLPAAWRR